MITITMTPQLRAICAHAETLEIDAPSNEEFQDLKADLVAAHAHIEHLHGLVKKYNLTRKITEVVRAWEESQC